MLTMVRQSLKPNKVLISSLIADVIFGKSIRQFLIAKVILQKSIRQGVFAHLKIQKKYSPGFIRFFLNVFAF